MSPVVYYWLVVVFVLGAVVGSFLNVAIARLPLEKSLLWPGSRCGHCFQSIRWYDNLPLISYLWLRGRCRLCGAGFSVRYFLVELATALGFVGLFYVEVVLNVHGWPNQDHAWPARGFYPWTWWVGFLYHATLFSFLMVASACDLDGREIPLPLTITGTIVGLIGSVLLPWPWPHAVADAVPPPGLNVPPGFQWMVPGSIEEGVYPWPVWGPLPAFLAPGGNWQIGLATGLAGALVGTFMMRATGWLFSRGLGKEALGLGDADLMMMAGAFLGWQPVVVGFFVSVIPALFIGVFQVLVRRDNSLPFGPSLAAGLMISCLCWPWLGAYVQPLFFWGTLLAGLVIVMLSFLFGAGFLFRFVKGEDPPLPPAEVAPPPAQETESAAPPNV